MKHSQSDEVFALGPFRIETGPRKLLKGTRKVKLGGKAFDVLAALCKAKGDIVNYDYMQHHIWSLDEVNVLDFRHNVQRRVGDIRRAIGDSEKKEIIQTVAGEGYRL